MIQKIDSAEQQLLNDAFDGSGGFKDGGYCIQAEAEGNEKFAKRKQLAHYTNHQRQVIEANVLPITRNVERETDDEFLQAFWEDCDGNGTGINVHTSSVALESESGGFEIWFLDSPSDQPATEAEALSKRTYPRLNRITPLQTDDYDINGENNLLYFRYVSEKDENGCDVFTIYRKGSDGVGYFAKGNKEGDKVIESDRKQALHEPILVVFDKYPSPWRLPSSRYYSTAVKAKVIYNEESIIAYQAINSYYNILVNPNEPLTDKVNLSENAVWNTSTKGGASFTMPQYLSQDDTMGIIRQQVDVAEKQIYTSTNLNALSASADSSGDSRVEADKIRIEGLIFRAELMETFETTMTRFFLKAIGRPNVEFTISYPTEFASMTKMAEIELFEKAIETGVAPENKKSLLTRIMLMLTPNATKEQRKDISDAEASNTLDAEFNSLEIK